MSWAEREGLHEGVPVHESEPGDPEKLWERVPLALAVEGLGVPVNPDTLQLQLLRLCEPVKPQERLVDELGLGDLVSDRDSVFRDTETDVPDGLRVALGGLAVAVGLPLHDGLGVGGLGVTGMVTVGGVKVGVQTGEGVGVTLRLRVHPLGVGDRVVQVRLCDGGLGVREGRLGVWLDVGVVVREPVE